jgi:hypothetical protein
MKPLVVRVCPEHELELVEQPDGTLRCPAGHVAVSWLVVRSGRVVATSSLSAPLGPVRARGAGASQ